MKHWLGLSAFLLVAGVIAFIITLPRPLVVPLEDRLEWVEPGMSKKAVIRIMGEPYMNHRHKDGSCTFLWCEDADRGYPLQVEFDQNGLVTKKEWVRPWNNPRKSKQ